MRLKIRHYTMVISILVDERECGRVTYANILHEIIKHSQAFRILCIRQVCQGANFLCLGQKQSARMS